MENSLTLPPLVRGKVTGFLKLFVDEVIIFKNIFRLITNCDIIVQIQWWGEILPIFLRPQKCQVINQTENQIHNNTFQTATYEIKTTLNLFNAYLETCDTLELVIIEADENFVIGSAFLRNLVNLLKKSNDFIALPIVDYLGDEIGEVKVFLNLSMKSLKEESKSEINKQNLSLSTDSNSIKPNIVERKIPYEPQSKQTSEKDNPCNFLMYKNTKKILSESDNSMNENSCCRSNFKDISFEFFNRGQTYKSAIKNLDLSNDSRAFKNELCHCYENNLVCKKFGQLEASNQEKLRPNFPQSQNLTDYSKVISYDAKQSKKHTTSKKQAKPLTFTEITSNLKTKSATSKKQAKPLTSAGISSNLETNSAKQACKLLPSKQESPLSKKVQCNAKKDLQTLEKQRIDIKESKCFEGICQSAIQNECHKMPHSDISTANYSSNVLSKQSFKKNLINYLLGYNMSKEDKESALNELRNMSPCQHFVETISQCYVHSEGNVNKSKKINVHSNDNKSNEKKIYDKVNYLNFNFNYPVERRYYERFFVGEESSHAFQIAETLNQPQVCSFSQEQNLNKETNNFNVLPSRSRSKKVEENSIVLDLKTNCKKVDRENHFNTLPSRSKSKKTEKNLGVLSFEVNNEKDDVNNEKLVISKNKEEICEVYDDFKTNQNQCSDKNACCEYFNKLKELDKIIDSLNRFEKKILPQ